ncbi:hypothetical protein BpHYR1_036991 [Brachionus plicatilis]|uniref:Uncharacterized protein n=1 Tax=Brachionus plicatilis TaxID=10195 RepID=A0A3M7SXV6_BRAPC|nr:hypothetical protein BpHYR1_036991 [Brachionus plicatilis]
MPRFSFLMRLIAQRLLALLKLAVAVELKLLELVRFILIINNDNNINLKMSRNNQRNELIEAIMDFSDY